MLMLPPFREERYSELHCVQEKPQQIALDVLQ